MFDPSLGRWMQQDPIGFDAGDVNLYRFVGNNPTNFVDPSGLQGVQVGPEPKIIEEGQGEPPDNRAMRPPPVKLRIRGRDIVYSNDKPRWDPLYFTSERLPRVLFKDQVTETPEGTLIEDVEVRGWGTRRFPDGRSNDSGDHIAWVVVQGRSLRREFTDTNCVRTKLPDRWKRIGFALKYGVYLRNRDFPSLLDLERRVRVEPTDTWETFVNRYISAAQALGD